MTVLRMCEPYDSESIASVFIDHFRKRINAATAISTLLVCFAETTTAPDAMDYAMLSMVADGINDILTTAIEEFEQNVEREEARSET